MSRRSLAAAPLVLLLAGCAAGEPKPEPASDPDLRLNDIQVLGSHNSYKLAIDRALFEHLLTIRPAAAIRGLDYAHVSLGEQLDLGLRKLELDVFYDPEGGRYANPWGLRWARERGAEAAAFDPAGAMDRPGFKVLHVQDADFRSSCLTLRDCFDQLLSWSRAHPRHIPIAVSFNAKDQAIDNPSYVEPLPFDEAAFDALDRELREVLPRQRLITPADVQGDHPTLRDSVLADGWPALEQSRGRFLLILDEGETKQRAYRGGESQGAPLLFVNAAPEHPDAAVLIRNDPLGDLELIRRRVAEGFLVRTRADADTREARSGATERRDAALRSGAHFVSTDYYREDVRFASGYRVALPGGGVVRCNPVRRSAGCSIVE